MCSFQLSSLQFCLHVKKTYIPASPLLVKQGIYKFPLTPRLTIQLGACPKGLLPLTCSILCSRQTLSRNSHISGLLLQIEGPGKAGFLAGCISFMKTLGNRCQFFACKDSLEMLLEHGALLLFASGVGQAPTFLKSTLGHSYGKYFRAALSNINRMQAIHVISHFLIVTLIQ